jgi:hypothetical protein
VIGAAAAALFSAGCGAEGPGADQDSKDPALCHAPSWVRGAPETIEDVTALINALADEHGGTVDLPCFVASLSRPLGAAASSNFISAQPAKGARSPRMFLWSGNLVLSVAPEGLGDKLLELGFQTSPTRSIKAEIEFPVTKTLSLAAPYERTPAEPQTRCAACHPGEKPAESVTWATAFESDVLRIDDDDLVAVESIAQESKKCNAAVEPRRCALLGAIFDQGGVHAQAFSPEARTLYGN